MAKLFSKTKIIRVNDGVEEVIPKGVVFDATPTEAKQFDALKSARPATAEEVSAHNYRLAVSQGQVVAEPAAPVAEPLPDSGAVGDPRSAPKGKSA